MDFSKRIQSVSESGTTRFSSLIADLAAQGKPVINLAVGEPDIPAPAPVIEACTEALHQGKTRYGPVPGIPELRTALAEAYQGMNQENIIITNGAKQGLYSLFQVILDPLDEVIIPSPFWTSFPMQVKLAGGKPVFVKTGHMAGIPHVPDPRAIESAVTSRTRAILINSPNNPAGTVYPEEILEQIIRVAMEKGLYIISDEAYLDFVYDGVKAKSLLNMKIVQENPEAGKHIIVCSSFSKPFSMTGFRVGHVAARSSLIQAMTRIQSHLCGNVCTFAQWAALSVFSMDKSHIQGLVRDLEIKRDIACDMLSAIFPVEKPGGAFYLFPEISRWTGEGKTAEDLAEFLLKTANVALVPGEAFGAPGYIRISYAVKTGTLKEALSRITGVLL